MQPSLLSVRCERSFKTGLTFRYSFYPLTIQFSYSLSGWPMTKDAGQIFQIPIPEMVRSFQRNDFWDSLGRPALLMTG